MNPRTVMFLSNAGDLVGGGEHSLLDLIGALRAAPEVRAVVVCPEDGELVRRLRGLGMPVDVVEFPAWRPATARGIARALRRLSRLVRARAPHVLHCNATSRIALYAGLVGRWRRVPVIWHVRVGDREGWKDRLIAGLMSRVVVNSDAVGRRFPWLAPPRLRRIHNGVDVARFATTPPRVAVGRALVAGAVGRFVAYKGFDDLLRAAAAVHDKHPDVRWVLVGDGPERARLEALRDSLGLQRVVTFAGWQADVAPWLASFDVFVLPSRGEHFGRVLVEAMALGKPVVATDAGGVPEIVRDGETGLLAPPADPAALAAAVARLVEDAAQRARLGEAGRRRAADEFSLERHRDALRALYQEVGA
ncbi:MAG TPA: glycosyltransferase [Methylomirabilota bacterium]|nr:glycosyltransferase [Methylomirabilota bacterium]